MQNVLFRRHHAFQAGDSSIHDARPDHCFRLIYDRLGYFQDIQVSSGVMWSRSRSRFVFAKLRPGYGDPWADSAFFQSPSWHLRNLHVSYVKCSLLTVHCFSWWFFVFAVLCCSGCSGCSVVAVLVAVVCCWCCFAEPFPVTDRRRFGQRRGADR